MESFLFDDISSAIQNEAIQRIILPMSVQLCHLLISMERTDVANEAFASLEKMAEDLAKASEAFVQAAKRLAADSGEEWLRAEMEPAAESLILSGRNISCVAQKLHLQPECHSHREELVTTAQQIVVGTAKVLLLEDAARARRTALAVGRCLTCLDALEVEDDAASLSGPFADLAAALLRLGTLTARGPGHLLRACVPALVAAARGHLRHPRDPQLAASRRHALVLTREALGELLALLEPGAAARVRTRSGALPRRLRQLRELLAEPRAGSLSGLLDAPLAAVLGHCMRLAAGCAPPERLRLVARCGRLLELRGTLSAWGSGRGNLEPTEERAALRAAAEALSQGVRTALLRQILDAFTDTQSPLQRLVQAALATPKVGWPHGAETLPESLRPFLEAFLDQAKQMLRVAHLVLVCCPRPQTCKDLEAATVGLWALVVRVQQLFSPSPQGSGLDQDPATLQALLPAWAGASQCLLACFDAVLNIPEFLSVSIQEMARHLPFLTWALKNGDPREFCRPVVYLQGRATHIVQVMSRYVGQERDPIFRNGLRVLIQQLAQSCLVLGEVAERCSDGHSSQDTDVVLAMAKQLICSAQSVLEGLDGTNHPDILSPLRDQVQRLRIAKGHPGFILPSLWATNAPELKCQRVPGLEEGDLGTSCFPRDHPSCPWIPDIHPQRRVSAPPAVNKLTLAVESQDHQTVPSAGVGLLGQGAAVGADPEALAGEGPLGSEQMAGVPEISALRPSACELPREVATRADGLLKGTLQLSGRTRETRQSLVAVAGDWYHLCQQLFCHNRTADLPGNMAVFMELQQNLASMVQLAAQSGPMDLTKQDPNSAGHPEVLVQMQGRLKEAETRAKQLMDTVLAWDGLQAPKSWEKDIEDGCFLWSVAVQDLIQYMERFSERQGLFLLPLRQAVERQQGLKEGLEQAADASRRLREAARLSGPLSGSEQVKGEVSFLCREVHVLTDALLDVAQILVSCPKLSPSLSTRFQLLCLEFALRAKSLTGHFRSINADYECALQDVFCSRRSGCKDPQSTPESSLETMASRIQAVQEIVASSRESGPCQEDLMGALESILVLTKEVAQRVPLLREQPEEWGMHVLDWLRWEWAAKAHYVMAQLQAWKGGHSEAWRLLAQCLKPAEEPPRVPEQDSVQSQLPCKEAAAGTNAVGSVDSQGASLTGSPGSTVGTCTRSTAEPTTADLDMGPKRVSQCSEAVSLVLLRKWRQPAAKPPQWITSLPPAARLAGCSSQHLDKFSESNTRGSGKALGGSAKGPTGEEQGLAVSSGSRLKSGHPDRPPAELAQPLPGDGGADGDNRLTRITQQMAKEVLLMAQSLKGRRLLTKDQLITSARKIVTSGQDFARLICFLAKNCVDPRCSQELVCKVEQIQTMSNQLRIISRVKASLARSQSSEELLVGTAQQLLRAVSETVRAAEAASLRGLRQPPPDPEELEVAAFCMQWRRKLVQHRLQEISDRDCDEWGLRTASTNTLPRLAAVIGDAV
ncbi:uncharacterized protein LOC133772415 [Lepus europaeus]|uniref:uncharacterized protein LOC133772415 n=1 Tax=Lepus europaeus TaxID=9983 RepID=UPI002B45FD06|nr:uncharacterized protein LOC133772415 [Lepus europaeus]